MKRAERIEKLPPYLFAEIDRKKAEAKAKGVDLIHIGVGDPDQPTPESVVAELLRAGADPALRHYPESVGLGEFRQAAAAWYEKTFHVTVDPKTEVTALIGSKEGLSQVCLAFLNPGDYALVPDPAYPAYQSGVILSGGIPFPMPLLEANGFLPVLDDIPVEIADKAKLMFLNYPNNPTAGVANRAFFEKVVQFAKKHDIIVCHDFAYGTMTFDGYQAPSFLSVEGAKDVGIEFNSMSKPFNMTGWRIGFAMGNSDVIKGIAAVKSNVDSGQFNPIQKAAIAAFALPESHYAQMNALYVRRRDFLVDGLNELGWKIKKPQATFYLWVPVPEGYTSSSFAAKLLDDAGIIVGPGNGYGEYGEGYFRVALTIDEARMKEALERIKQVM